MQFLHAYHSEMPISPWPSMQSPHAIQPPFFDVIVERIHVRLGSALRSALLCLTLGLCSITATAYVSLKLPGSLSQKS